MMLLALRHFAHCRQYWDVVTVCRQYQDAAIVCRQYQDVVTVCGLTKMLRLSA